MKRVGLAGLLTPVTLLFAGGAGCTPAGEGATLAEQIRGFLIDFLRQVLAAYVT